jgi:hypothetical protein
MPLGCNGAVEVKLNALSTTVLGRGKRSVLHSGCLACIDVGEREENPLPCQASNTEPCWLVKAATQHKISIRVANCCFHYAHFNP